MDAWIFQAHETWVEENLRGAEPAPFGVMAVAFGNSKHGLSVPRLMTEPSGLENLNRKRMGSKKVPHQWDICLELAGI